MRVQRIENLNKVLDFLKRKRIQLENIGAEDILDGNERLILGLIWTIILRFQIDTIVIDVRLSLLLQNKASYNERGNYA